MQARNSIAKFLTKSRSSRSSIPRHHHSISPAGKARATAPSRITAAAMVKRKRNEPKLATQLEDFEVKLFRALKVAKGFERQRLAKRVREANPDKVERLEREVAVLKVRISMTGSSCPPKPVSLTKCSLPQCLDLHQAAHAILCSHLLKIKGIAESPNLPEQIKPVPKPDITEDERTALHNVTSGLCNRKQVKDVLDEAIMTTCIALRVPMPDKKAKGKVKGKEEQEGQEKEKATKPARPLTDAGKEKNRATPAKSTESDDDAEDTEDSGQEGWEGFGSGQDAEDEEEVEKAISRYDALLGGSSDSEDGDDGDESDDEDRQNSRSATFGRGKSEARGKSDYFSGSSAEEESDEDGEDQGGDAESDEEAEGEDEEAISGSDDSEEEALPPPKKARNRAAAKAAPASNGNSTFLPSLLGGYISGSESEAEDLDDIAPKKNRRGQRARQAIWEKKFKEQAKHLNKPKDSRDSGWDPKRGAVVSYALPNSSHQLVAICPQDHC